MRTVSPQDTIFNEVSADGASNPVFVKDSRHITIEVVMTGFTGTLKFLGALKDTADGIDFGASASLTNPIAYVEVIDTQNTTTPITGNTGITGSNTTGVRFLEVNKNMLTWIGAIISGYSAGTVTVKVSHANDN